MVGFRPVSFMDVPLFQKLASHNIIGFSYVVLYYLAYLNRDKESQ